MERIEDCFTKQQRRRGEQIDKVQEFYEAATCAFVRRRFAKAANTLARLRDYLDSLDLPRKQTKEESEVK